MVPKEIKFKEIRESYYQIYKWYMMLKSCTVIFHWWGQIISHLDKSHVVMNTLMIKTCKTELHFKDIC